MSPARRALPPLRGSRLAPGPRELWRALAGDPRRAFEEARANFETAYARANGGGDAVLLPSGRAGLRGVLEALGDTAGREVVLPAFLDASLLEVARALGLRPVFCDVRRTNGTMDPARLAAALGERTHAVVVIHMFGRPADLPAIHAVASARGVPVVEDCAHSPVSPFAARSGAWSVASFTSFAVFKLVDCGGGGGVHTFDAGIAARVRGHAAAVAAAATNAFTTATRVLSAAAARVATAPGVYDALGHPLFRGLTTAGDGAIPFYKKYVRPFLKRGADTGTPPLPGALLLAAGCAQFETLADRVAARRRLALALTRGLPRGVLLQAEAGGPGSSEYAQFAVVRDRDAALVGLARAGVDALPSPMVLGGEPGNAPVAAELVARGVQLPWYDGFDDADVERLRAALIVAAS